MVLVTAGERPWLGHEFRPFDRKAHCVSPFALEGTDARCTRLRALHFVKKARYRVNFHPLRPRKWQTRRRRATPFFDPCTKRSPISGCKAGGRKGGERNQSARMTGIRVSNPKSCWRPRGQKSSILRPGELIIIPPGARLTGWTG